jgi:hypothetical protein
VAVAVSSARTWQGWRHISFIKSATNNMNQFSKSELFIYRLLHKRVDLKDNIKIDIKTAPTCFGAITPSSGSALVELAKVTVVKIMN